MIDLFDINYDYTLDIKSEYLLYEIFENDIDEIIKILNKTDKFILNNSLIEYILDTKLETINGIDYVLLKNCKIKLEFFKESKVHKSIKTTTFGYYTKITFENYCLIIKEILNNDKLSDKQYNKIITKFF